MSELNNVLLVTPPKHFGERNGEVLTSHNHICPHCNGRKEFTTQIGYNTYETETCPICKGKGELMAKIVIGWVPEEQLL